MTPSAHTASAASKLNPPLKTDKRRRKRAFGLVEKVVTPGDGGLQGLLARLRAPPAAGEETGTCPPRHLRWRPGDIMRVRAAASSMARASPSSRSQIRATTLRLGVVGLEPGTHQRRPLGEQLYTCRNVQRRHPPRHLTGDALSGSRLVASTDQVGDGKQQLFGETGGGRKDCLQLSSTSSAS